MNTENIVMCVVALLLGMLLANMLKNVCGCKVVEGVQASFQRDMKQSMKKGANIQQIGSWSARDPASTVGAKGGSSTGQRAEGAFGAGAAGAE